eukprot:m.888601 g.888601  ORF g.888601 m.888601 type:complete len:124 (+) comp23639_c0_seq3:786-1157(+)
MRAAAERVNENGDAGVDPIDDADDDATLPDVTPPSLLQCTCQHHHVVSNQFCTRSLCTNGAFSEDISSAFMIVATLVEVVQGGTQSQRLAQLARQDLPTTTVLLTEVFGRLRAGRRCCRYCLP